MPKVSNPVGNITVGTEQMTPKQGDYVKDQIVNIRGNVRPFHSIMPRVVSNGALNIVKVNNHFYNPFKSGPDAWTTLDFDASRVVQTGDRVMPRTIFQNLYVIVSEE